MKKIIALILFFALPYSANCDRRYVRKNASAPLTTYLYDTFTDANGTNLNVHTMDIGSGWTERTSPLGGISIFTILTNKAVSAGGLYRVVTADGTTADGTLTMDFSVPNSTTYLGAFTFRWSATGALWFAGIENDGGTAYIAIYQYNGSAVLRASTNFVSNPQNTVVNVTLVMNGANLTLTTNVPMVGTCTYGSATFNQTATQHGIFDYQDLTYVLPFLYDNFKFTN